MCCVRTLEVCFEHVLCLMKQLGYVYHETCYSSVFMFVQGQVTGVGHISHSALFKWCSPATLPHACSFHVFMAGSSSASSTPHKKCTTSKSGMDFSDDNASSSLIAAVEQHRKLNASACSGPMDTLVQLKEERRIAREENAKKRRRSSCMQERLHACKSARRNFLTMGS